MTLHNPLHPGEFIASVYLEPHGISGRELAAKLGVAASTLNRILKGRSNISPEMALRLAKCLGRSPRVGLQCSKDMTCGKPSGMWTSGQSNGWTCRLRDPPGVLQLSLKQADFHNACPQNTALSLRGENDALLQSG